jgi:hypothetical protein
MKILLDTGVFISYFGRSNEPEREVKARLLIDFFINLDFDIYYSQRTQYELNVEPSEIRNEFLNKCILANYYFGNETVDQIEGTSENIGSLINNDSDGEFDLAEGISNWLLKLRDIRDRGILLDAIKSECKFFIHENPKDFNKIPTEFFKEYGLICINLLELEIYDFEKTFKRY